MFIPPTLQNTALWWLDREPAGHPLRETTLRVQTKGHPYLWSTPKLKHTVEHSDRHAKPGWRSLESENQARNTKNLAYNTATSPWNYFGDIIETTKSMQIIFALPPVYSQVETCRRT